MRVLILLMVMCAAAMGQMEIEVIHKKPLWRDQKGNLSVEPEELCFHSTGKSEDPRCWSYADIQHLDRVSRTELVLLSYEDAAWKLGRDRRYRFVLSAGELSDEVFAGLESRVAKPATDRVAEAPPAAELELPAKQLKTFGGSEGILYFTPERIVYATDAESESREWLVARDVSAVWSADPYRVEIHVREGDPGPMHKPRVYRFALKEPLDSAFYQRLKHRLYALDRASGVTR